MSERLAHASLAPVLEAAGAATLTLTRHGCDLRALAAHQAEVFRLVHLLAPESAAGDALVRRHARSLCRLREAAERRR